MESIAIIGMGCRIPGATSPEAFWQLIRSRVDAITEVPESRWNRRELYDVRPQTPGKMSTIWCGVLDNVEEFDHEFFGISPREAMHMDPQQRLLLEVAWQALEHAGQSPDQLRGSDTGIFVGMSSDDYSRLYFDDFAMIEAYSGTGNALSVAANRISYLFDFRGPSWVVDTACSSSLVAIHQACQSLRLRECSLAIAGGVNLILAPHLTIAFSQAGMLSPRGRCRAFDDSADGYVRGEGCGLVVLKRLSDALRDRDNILALIRGSAVNQDGRTNGLTSPNGLSQQAVIRKALESAGVSPAHISYIEAHGTGTSLGDPIEMNSLMEILMQGRSPKDRCWVGSVKTNIGHLEAAAGIAGLMKVVLALMHKEIPPQLHLKSLNRYISFAGTPISIPLECEPWPGERGRRLAGVSSFGFAGTNAHVILQEAPLREIAPAPMERPLHVLTLSARNKQTLQRLSGLYAQSCLRSGETGGELQNRLVDLCYTANIGRSHFQHRLAIMTDSASRLCSSLQKFAQTGEVVEHVSLYNALRSRQRPTIAFLFTGQGSQYVGMGRELYETQPAFRRVVERCDKVFAAVTGESLISILYGSGEPGRIDQTAYAQPALFAVEMGLAELWRQWGIDPSFVMGHSVGEYAAACVAGVFSVEDGTRLVSARGRLMQGLAAGAMVAVFGERLEVEPVLQKYADALSIAAINGPRHVVISGRKTACEELVLELKRRGVPSQSLRVSHAFHSTMMQPMLREYGEVAKEVRYSSPELGLVSNVTGSSVSAEVTRGEYWVEHVVRPVQFEQGIRWLQRQGTDVFVEIGPKPTLLGLGRECCEAEAGRWHPSLRPGSSDGKQMLSSLAGLYAQGAEVSWHSFESHSERRCVSLPTYPFQRNRHWPDAANVDRHAQLSINGHFLHPLLGMRLRSALEEFQFESNISKDSPSFLDQHRVFDRCLVPAGVFVEMALAAAEAILRMDCLSIQNINFEIPLILEDQKERTVQAIVRRDQAGTYAFQIYSFSPDDIDGTQDWVRHVSGSILSDGNTKAVEIQPSIRPSTLGENCSEEIELSDSTRILTNAAFADDSHLVHKLWRNDGRILAQIVLPDSLRFDADQYFLHPVLLSACLLALLPIIPELPQEDCAWVPVAMEQIRSFRRSFTELWCEATLQVPPKDLLSGSSPAAKADFRLFSPQGDLVATLEGVQLKQITKNALLGNVHDASEPDLYRLEWEAVNLLDDESFGTGGFLLPPEHIVASLRTIVAKVAIEPEIRQLVEAHNILNELSVEYILRAFSDADSDIQAHQRFSIDQIAHKIGVTPRHCRLWNRLCEILRGAGVLQEDGDHWQLARVTPYQNGRERLDDFLNRFPTARAEMALLDRCGAHLGEVLAGRLDPLELIFPGGDLSLATQFYESSPGARAMNVLVEEAIKRALARLPAKRRLRILEIGAGTGGTTSFVLPHVPETAEYVFTDLSPLFLGKARDKFKDYPFVHYQLFDLEQEPQAQGFDLNGFDIVLAAHVVHATTDLRRALSHVRELIVPGGLLVLLEGTHPIPWVDLVFGLTEGWWKFTDRDLRPSYPLLSLNVWNDVLMESGFQSVATVSLSDEDPQLRSAPSVILAQNRRMPSQQEAPAPGHWLIFSDSGGSGRGVVERLKARGELCTIVERSTDFEIKEGQKVSINPENPAHFRQLLGEISHLFPLTGVMQLWSLDTPESHDLTTEGIETSFLLGLRTSLYLTQALNQVYASSPPKVWFLTRGAVSVGENPSVPGLSQSALWGFGKVVALEFPALWGGLVDLSPLNFDDDDMEAVVREVLDPSGEDFIAFRDHTLYRARIVHEPPPLPVPCTFEPRGTYLITGGLGSLGLKLAAWMVEKGARHIVLLGRRSPSLSARALIAKLRSAGCDIRSEQADVCDRKALEKGIPTNRSIRIPVARCYSRRRRWTLPATREYGL